MSGGGALDLRASGLCAVRVISDGRVSGQHTFAGSATLAFGEHLIRIPVGEERIVKWDGPFEVVTVELPLLSRRRRILLAARTWIDRTLLRSP